jgi:hypothetical protein
VVGVLSNQLEIDARNGATVRLKAANFFLGEKQSFGPVDGPCLDLSEACQRLPFDLIRRTPRREKADLQRVAYSRDRNFNAVTVGWDEDALAMEDFDFWLHGQINRCAAWHGRRQLKIAWVRSNLELARNVYEILLQTSKYPTLRTD